MKEINSNIHDSGKIQKIQTSVKKNKNSLEPKSDFHQILADQVNSGNQKTESLKSLSSLPELEKTLMPGFEKKHFDNTYFPDRIENVIDMLDTYSLWLADSNKTLKNVFPLLNDIADKVKILDQEINEDKNPDSQLKQIVNQLLTTIRLEQIKMQRGDYLET